MWPQSYTPVAGNTLFSALVAGVPLYVLFYLMAVRHVAGHVAGLAALASTLIVATLVFGMPTSLALSSALMGLAFAIFPIMWIVLNALFVYHLTLTAGRFGTVRASIAAVSEDQRLQALFIAFSFGALMEAIAGFGTPIALSSAMMVGVGFAPFTAVSLALIANTAPVAFGNLGTPIISLAGVIQPFVGGSQEELVSALSAMVGRQVTLLSLLTPAFLILVLSGWRRMVEVLPAVVVAGVAFATTQFLVSNYLGPTLASVAAALVTIVALLVLLQVWRPSVPWRASDSREGVSTREALNPRDVVLSWAPFVTLVLVVVVGNLPFVSSALDRVTLSIPWPGLHNQVLRMPPMVSEDMVGTPAAQVAAIYTFDWLRSAGTLALIAGLISMGLLRIRPRRALRVYLRTAHGLLWPSVGVGSVLALAWVMNYSGMTVTLGIFFTFAGPLFPFFSALIGWIGVLLTGSDTASNNLFGGLQVTTAGFLGTSEILAAATNSTGGVCAKMVSPQNLAIGAASVGLSGSEGALLHRTLFWSLAFVILVGLLALAQAYLLTFTIPPVPSG